VTETRRSPDTAPHHRAGADPWRVRLLWALVAVFAVALSASLLRLILL
jgi:hypothetical protein